MASLKIISSKIISMIGLGVLTFTFVGLQNVIAADLGKTKVTKHEPSIPKLLTAKEFHNLTHENQTYYILALRNLMLELENYQNIDFAHNSTKSLNRNVVRLDFVTALLGQAHAEPNADLLCIAAGQFVDRVAGKPCPAPPSPDCKSGQSECSFIFGAKICAPNPATATAYCKANAKSPDVVIAEIESASGNSEKLIDAFASQVSEHCKLNRQPSLCSIVKARVADLRDELGSTFHNPRRGMLRAGSSQGEHREKKGNHKPDGKEDEAPDLYTPPDDCNVPMLIYDLSSPSEKINGTESQSQTGDIFSKSNTLMSLTDAQKLYCNLNDKLDPKTDLTSDPDIQTIIRNAKARVDHRINNSEFTRGLSRIEKEHYEKQLRDIKRNLDACIVAAKKVHADDTHFTRTGSGQISNAQGYIHESTIPGRPATDYYHFDVTFAAELGEPVLDSKGQPVMDEKKQWKYKQVSVVIDATPDTLGYDLNAYPGDHPGIVTGLCNIVDNIGPVQDIPMKKAVVIQQKTGEQLDQLRFKGSDGIMH